MKRMVQMMGRWTALVFAGHEAKVTPKVRALRLLEEVIELCQAEEVSTSEILTVTEQVMSRPAGFPVREFGGVMVTVMGYASVTGFDPDEEFWTEFARIMDPAMMEKVRNRNLGGDKIGMEA